LLVGLTQHNFRLSDLICRIIDKRISRLREAAINRLISPRIFSVESPLRIETLPVRMDQLSDQTVFLAPPELMEELRVVFGKNCRDAERKKS
jgi:hypothetical protein